MSVSGILIMNKPRDFTSFDVIAKLRGILKIRRLGHTGTLDPMAEGVLPVLVGSATKACDILPNETKTYRAGFRLGVVTDTQDITGTVLSSTEVHITQAILEAVLPQFVGEIQQVPPMYSAVQINGKRLYDLAREGRIIERPARNVTVYDITLVCYDVAAGEGIVEITCGKGTYVRTILHDMGAAVGCGACMTSLIRTMASGFILADALCFADVEQIMSEGRLAEVLQPTQSLFATLPKLILSDGQARMYRNGVKLSLDRLRGVSDEERYAVYDTAGGFIGLAQADHEAQLLRVFKNFEER